MVVILRHLDFSTHNLLVFWEFLFDLFKNEITYATIVWGILVTRVEIQDMKFMKKINYTIPKDYLESIRQGREEEVPEKKETKKSEKKAKVKKTIRTEEIEVDVS